jgi:hypothetical protein
MVMLFILTRSERCNTLNVFMLFRFGLQDRLTYIPLDYRPKGTGFDPRFDQKKALNMSDL